MKPWWFHEVRKKKKLKPLGENPSGPAKCQSGLNFFLTLHEYHHGFKIYCQIIRETTKNVKKINEIRVTKIKKYAWSLLKSCSGDIFDKNTAARKKIWMLILK